MNSEPEKLNPYASPTPQDSDDANESSYVQFTTQIEESRAARTRWTVIFSLNALLLAILGSSSFNLQELSRGDIILRVIGGFVVFFSLGLYLVGPLLWYRFGKTNSQ